MKKSLLFFFLGLCCLTVQTFAQVQVVTGKVTSAEDGLPLPGVSVRVKGGSAGVATGTDGAYRINARTGQVLIFSYIGTIPQEITVGTRADISVKMAADASKLGEVVVTAFNIPRDKASLGYSTPTVKGDDVSQTQRDDFFGGLQGRVPGLSVNSTSGNPGASAQIVLRGFTSISGDNNALIVVDGVPINNTVLNQTRELVSGAANRDQDYSNRALDINPADIETYTIMKGPEATALYGSAGAGGAILITTKKGKAGKGNVSYNNSFKVQRVNKFPKMQQVYNQGSGGVYDPGSTIFEGPAFVPGTKIYDNIHSFFRTAFAQNHNLSFDGGTDKFTYRWSNEYADNQGAIPTSRYTRISSRLTGSAVISPLLKVTTSFNYIKSSNDKVNKGTNGPVMELFRFNPSWDVTKYQDVNGNRLLHTGTIYGEWDNPFWDVYKNTQNDKVNRVLGNTNFELSPTKWLKVNAIVGTDVTSQTGMQVYNGQSYKGSGSASAPTGGRIITYNRSDVIYNGSLTAVAKSRIGMFDNTFIIGGTFNDFNSTTDSQQGDHMYDPNFYSINNTLPTTQRALHYVNRYRNVGAFAQAVLGYKSLLFVTLTGRVDGSSKLMPSLNAATGTVGEANPYFAYPSVSTAFNFTELDAVKKAIPFLGYGKLRASYALTGKEPWREYSLGTNYAGANSSGGGYALSYFAGNPTLRPEKSKNFETGIEMQFLNNRLGIDFNYYNLRSEHQIINPRLSYGGGFVLELINGGTVVNKGVEIQLTGTPVKTTKLTWNVTVNYTQNKGTVLTVGDGLPELYDSDTWILGGIRSAVHPGYSTTAISGTRFDRNNAGDILISPSSGLPTSTDTRYYPIGDRTPKFTLGLVNNFTYKSFNLNFLWDLRYGGDVFNGTEYEAYTRGASMQTLDRETPRVITGVLKDGLENTANPTRNTIAVTPYYASTYYTTNVSPEQFVEHNIKTLRLRDITLTYNLPKSFVSRLGFLQSAGIFVTITDAVLLTNYSGMDPESNSNNAGIGGVGGYGIDYGNVGKPIGYNLGLRVRL
jgi:TonB-linked SusC/RagA family outer membrane protein